MTIDKPVSVQDLSPRQLFQAYCKSQSLWGLRVNPRGGDFRERFKSCPLFDIDFVTGRSSCGHMQGLADGEYYFFYGTENDLLKAYNLVVGKDGPTVTNPYVGPAATYALTCGPTGELLTENT